jgi:Subtilase family
MKHQTWLAGVLVALLWAAPAKADTGVVIRTTGGLQAVQALCLPATCTVVGGLDGTLGQVFLVTTPLPLQTFLGLLPASLTGFVDAEVNQLLSLVDLTSLVPSPIPTTLMQDRSSVPYPANSTQTAWNSYVNQPAALIVGVQKAQKTFSVTGTGIVADIDTGVDPTHPVLQPVLVPGGGYDFTRNQPGGSELNDLSSCPFPSTSPCAPPPCTPTTCSSPAQVNQSSAAILDQSSAAILDGNPQYKAFGHGTMVMGIIHLVAPTAQLMPLKAFHSDGTASLSDILRAIYYGVQNSAKVINMSFDTKTSSAELQKALDYANQQDVICVASAGNDGVQETVYPAAIQNDVMGVASTTDQDTRSSFSNFGNAIVWVAAPGEAIVSTYPFDTYAAGWGTSFSAPFVSGGAALLHNLNAAIMESGAAAAVANAAPLDPSWGLNHGRLDLMMALGSLGGTPDYSVSASPPSGTITAGQKANFTVSAVPAHGFNQTVTWSCTGAPAAATCTVSPSSVTLDGSNTATATVTLATTARGLVIPLVLRREVPPLPLYEWEISAALLALFAVLLTVCTLGCTPRRRPGLAAAAGVLAVSLCVYSCGEGGNPPGSPTLSSIGLNPTSVTGGSPSTGTVTLSGSAAASGAIVNLSSSASAATVPASVTVAPGASSANFMVSTSAVSASTPVTITASFAGATKTASLTVVPQALPILSSLMLNPTSVTGGAQSSTGTVTLSGPALTGGAQVLLSSDNGAASVPASVTVAAGASTANFTVSTSVVSMSTPVTITASYGGVSKTGSLTVNPPSGGTPAGTYTLTVTGTSGNLSHATTVQVTVN